MADKSIAVRTHLIVEILLGGKKFQCAGLAAGKPFEGRVADLLGYWDDVFPELGDRDQALLEL